ncbi:hypothetical protein K3G39_00690 [Pontibacter sp. HSC-14F20]|uniref:hypothetical protein n=1 Tax=Pontibacter sp. HSC-14F20 TaxID=2864136 RepID=UPI001C734E5A|nr:hypothetical protein [Pontibacter sp. HSC-14F20]MBX0331745.1 hypothetical protein [Pontibacter sp. HSC-14F20]
MIEFLFALIGLSIQLIFLYKRKMLTDNRNEIWLWIGTAILFIAGLTLGNIYGSEIKTLPLLMVPLMAYIIYRLLFWTYLSAFKEEPVDTFWSMNIKLMRLGVFNFLFWFLALVVPVLVAFKLVK